MTFLELLHAGRLLKWRNWSTMARQTYLRAIKDEPICPICGAHRPNYLLAMLRPCHEEHGIGSLT